MAGYLVAAFRVPTRRACHVVQCNRATFYYRSQRRDLTPLRMRLRELAAARPRFGYRRLHVLLRREGWRINHKNVGFPVKLDTPKVDSTGASGLGRNVSDGTWPRLSWGRSVL